MALFRNTADLKLFADIHRQTDWSTLKPYVEQAENSYIIPLLGQAQFNIFYSPVHSPSNAEKSFEQIFTDELQLECFRLVARSLANYALYEAFPFLNTSVGDIGVMQQQSKEGTATAAPQWRYESRRAAHLNVADSYADKMLAFLELHKSVFTPWAESSSFTINKELFIDDSVKLSKYLGTGESRRAYLALRPYIRLAEKQYIITAIGQETYDEIKAQMKTNPATFSETNQVLLPMIEEALAWSAYYDALPFIAIRITGDGVQVVSRNDGINNRNAASMDEKKEARAQAGRFMDSFLGTLRKYMDVNMDAYPLYRDSLADSTGYVYRRPINRKGSGHFSV
jgi:hypothetical protein